MLWDEESPLPLQVSTSELWWFARGRSPSERLLLLGLAISEHFLDFKSVKELFLSLRWMISIPSSSS